MIASVLPDIDLLYFYLIDHRQTLHHEYWTHLPLYWVAAWIVVAGSMYLFKRREALIVSMIFFANIILHFVLDTTVGGELWLYPFRDTSFALVTIPARYDFWVQNFVLHWTFLVEITICLAALFVCLHGRIGRKRN